MIKKERKTLLFIPAFFFATILFVLPITKLHASDLNLEQHKGKVVYLDFWASWCGPCRQSFPFMNNLKATYEAQGLVVVSVNVDEKPADAEKFLKKYPANFEVVYDHKGDIAKEFQLKAMPTSILFDRDGNQVDYHLGFKNKDIEKITNKITTLLNKN